MLKLKNVLLIIILPIIVGVISCFIYDAIKEKPLLTTIIDILNLNLKLWWVLIIGLSFFLISFLGDSQDPIPIKETKIDVKNVLHGNVSGGNVSVGDNYTGIKQRHLDLETFNGILKAVQDLCIAFPKYDKTKVDIAAKDDLESHIYATELVDKFKEHGYQPILNPLSNSPYPTENIIIGPGMNNWPLIVIQPAKNVQTN